MERVKQLISLQIKKHLLASISRSRAFILLIIPILLVFTGTLLFSLNNIAGNPKISNRQFAYGLVDKNTQNILQQIQITNIEAVAMFVLFTLMVVLSVKVRRSINNY